MCATMWMCPQVQAYARQLLWTLSVFNDSASPLVLASTEYPHWETHSVKLMDLCSVLYVPVSPVSAVNRAIILLVAFPSWICSDKDDTTPPVFVHRSRIEAVLDIMPPAAACVLPTCLQALARCGPGAAFKGHCDTCSTCRDQHNADVLKSEQYLAQLQARAATVPVPAMPLARLPIEFQLGQRTELRLARKTTVQPILVCSLPHSAGE